MNAVHKLMLGLLLAGTLIGLAVSAAAQAPSTASEPQPGAPAATGRLNVNRFLDTRLAPYPSQLQPAQLAQQYVTAEKDEEKNEIRKKLTELLSQQFDQHLKQQQEELDDLEKQVASLKAVLKKRLNSKGAIIERRLEQLVKEAEGLGWNTSSSPHRPSTRLGLPPIPEKGTSPKGSGPESR